MTCFRDNLFEGKSCFISGGTSGINLGIAKGLAALGARVAVLGRDAEKAGRAAAEISALGPAALALSGDVRSYESLQQAIGEAAEAFGGLDFVIAGAAGNFIAPVAKLSPNGFKAVVDIDLNGSFHLFKAAYPHLNKPGASLIAISAGQATRPSWGQAHAAAAKAGIEQLVRTLALEWGPEGIRVNCLCPGAIAGTEGVDRLMPAALQESLRKRLLVPRLGTVQDIADAAIFLLGPAGSYVTGTTLVCDGGLQYVSYDSRG